MIVFPAGVHRAEQELLDVLDLELHQKLNVHDVLVARDHQRLFEEGSVAAHTDLKASALPNVDDGAVAYRVRPPPVKARPRRVLEHAEPSERRDLGGLDRVEAGAKPHYGA